MPRHPDRNPDVAPPALTDRDLFPKGEPEDALPRTFAAALIPREEETASFIAPPTRAVVLQWRAPDAEGAPGRSRAGYYELMLTADSLESAVRVASALNLAEA